MLNKLFDNLPEIRQARQHPKPVMAIGNRNEQSPGARPFIHGRQCTLAVTGGILHMQNWLSLGGAAEHLDVSTDTILRRALPWQEEHVPGKVRWKYLKLGIDTRMQRRYWIDDLDALLMTG